VPANSTKRITRQPGRQGAGTAVAESLYFPVGSATGTADMTPTLKIPHAPFTGIDTFFG